MEQKSAEAASGTNMAQAPALPFDANKLDALLDQAGIDALVVSSKHNIQYLLGGYRFFFFDHFDAIGVSRYLPLLVYVRGRPEDAAYFANPMESYEEALGKFWTPKFEKVWGSVGAMQAAAAYLKGLGKTSARIGVERAFLPADAEEALRKALPGARIVDALLPLERLRAVKTPEELGLLREASSRVVDSMLAVIAGHGPGATKLELVQALKREEVQRGLTFEYCLITAGTSRNRAPSDEVWGDGDILSLDSGGNYKGYIGDLCRMAIHGEPDAELVDLLGEIDAIQQAARRPIRAGVPGGEILRGGRAARAPVVARQLAGIRCPWHGSDQPRGAAAHRARAGALSGRRRREAACRRHGAVDRDDARPSPTRLHQAGGHRGGHRGRLGGLRRWRPRLEPRRNRGAVVSGIEAP